MKQYMILQSEDKFYVKILDSLSRDLRIWATPFESKDSATRWINEQKRIDKIVDERVQERSSYFGILG